MEHLENIQNILNKFIKKHNFLMYYLRISGVVESNTRSKLNIECMNAFDYLTVKEVKDIQMHIYEDIRKYLENNSIEKAVHIDSQMRGGECIGIRINFTPDFLICK